MRKINNDMKKQDKFTDPVSIVLPAYNEEKCILPSLKILTDYCRTHFHEFEIICVDDGSRDRTWDRIGQMPHSPCIRTFRLPQNRGKGYAVKHGMLHAQGRFRFFTDADLPYSLNAFTAAMEFFSNTDCDLVTGARDLPNASISPECSFLRKVASRTFSGITRHIVNIDVHDTQCGFKGFTDTAANRIFPQLQIPGYAFDVEIFVLARALGLNVCRVPVKLIRNEYSNIRLIRDPFMMLLDVMKLSRRTFQ
ncbi:glycosyltransferase [Thermodesulfobacteriota bacterium]